MTAQASSEQAVVVPSGLARLQRHPVIDTIDEKTFALIASQIAPGCNHGEIGHFLELCAHYDLDPFAREAWCAKSKKTSKLLIMVGRDGLRKIAQRQRLHVDGDVVRESDTYAVELIEREADAEPGEWEANGAASFHRVTHKWQGMGAQRGAVAGSWARVREIATGRECGWFEAPLEEYMPSNASDYSPWSKQVGVMILAAAERQAIRQATPLSGLLAIGEDEVVFDHEGTAEELPALPAVPPDESDVANLYRAIEAIGWDEDEARLHLAAAGAQDTTDLPTAVRTLTADQCRELADRISAQVEQMDEQAAEAVAGEVEPE